MAAVVGVHHFFVIRCTWGNHGLKCLEKLRPCPGVAAERFADELSNLEEAQRAHVQIRTHAVALARQQILPMPNAGTRNAGHSTHTAAHPVAQASGHPGCKSPPHLGNGDGASLLCVRGEEKFSKRGRNIALIFLNRLGMLPRRAAGGAATGRNGVSTAVQTTELSWDEHCRVRVRADELQGHACHAGSTTGH